jgi:hypothetical protein
MGPLRLARYRDEAQHTAAPRRGVCRSSAHMWLHRRGDGATVKAREMVEATRKKGDENGADVWRRHIFCGPSGTRTRRDSYSVGMNTLVAADR